MGLQEMGEEERAEFLKSQAVPVASALEKIIVNGFKALGLQYFFTAGADEVKAWTIKEGTTAPGAAGRIHTDFEKGFIMAEVMKFTDFKEFGSEACAMSPLASSARARASAKFCSASFTLLFALSTSAASLFRASFSCSAVLCAFSSDPFA